MALMSIMPDTPRWYYAQNRHAEGDDVLARLHSSPLEHDSVQQQKREIIASLELEKHGDNKLSLISVVW